MQIQTKLDNCLKGSINQNNDEIKESEEDFDLYRAAFTEFLDRVNNANEPALQTFMNRLKTGYEMKINFLLEELMKRKNILSGKKMNSSPSAYEILA
jgi:hypothetical protein